MENVPEGGNSTAENVGVYMGKFLFILGIVFVFHTKSHACRGASTLVANENDAETVFEGRLVSFFYEQKTNSNELTFAVLRTVRGESKAKWTVRMRGERRPKTKEEYIKQFGSQNEIGIRLFKAHNSNGKYFIVDNACSMNNDDWFIRSMRSYRALEVETEVTSSVKNSLSAIQKRVSEDVSLVTGCWHKKQNTVGRWMAQLLITSRGPGQYVNGKMIETDIPYKDVQKCIIKAMKNLRMPWITQNLSDLITTNITYKFSVCATDSNRKCLKN